MPRTINEEIELRTVQNDIVETRKSISKLDQQIKDLKHRRDLHVEAMGRHVYRKHQLEDKGPVTADSA